MDGGYVEFTDCRAVAKRSAEGRLGCRHRLRFFEAMIKVIRLDGIPAGAHGSLGRRVVVFDAVDPEQVLKIGERAFFPIDTVHTRGRREGVALRALPLRQALRGRRSVGSSGTQEPGKAQGQAG